MGNKTCLYMQVHDALKTKIEGGFYGHGDLLPSEREIGETFLVDRTTVRKALELLVEDGLVEKKAGVGTRVLPPAAATAEPSANSRTVAFFLPASPQKADRITQPFYSTLFYHVEKECRRNGYTLIYSTLNCNDDFPAILAAGHYAGVFFVSNVERKFIDHAVSQHIPTVLLNDYYGSAPSVVPDNFGGAYLACRHLISLGHRHFAFIKGISSFLSTMERFSGCVVALAEADLRIQDQYVTEATWEPDSDSYGAVTKMLQTLPTPPTAIVAFNDSIAAGCLRAVYEFGLRVPEDISVFGFDDVQQAQQLIPPLSTVRQEFQMMAQTAVQHLAVQAEHPDTICNVKIVCPCSLVLRGSTADIKKK